MHFAVMYLGCAKSVGCMKDYLCAEIDKIASKVDFNFRFLKSLII